MNRRILLFGLPALCLVATGAVADVETAIVRRLRADGYGDITVSRTLLGRVRIVATKPGLRREIILNPQTGEVLRDLLIAQDGTELPGTLAADHDDGGSGGTGNDDSDDDEDEDEDEDEDKDEDNSGHGNSGDDDGGKDD